VLPYDTGRRANTAPPRDPGRRTSSSNPEEITIKITPHTIAARIVPFLLVLAVFGLTGVQVASAATTTPAPTQAPVPMPVIVTKPGAKNFLEPTQIALAAQMAGFSGPRLVTAVAVAMAESRGNADAVSRSRAYGLWQILAHAHPDLIRSSNPHVSRWFDPYVNARFAWQVSNGGKNWRPWSVYKHRTYRRYLARARAAVRMLQMSPLTVTAPVVK
jgi:hypothetical protein